MIWTWISRERSCMYGHVLDYALPDSRAAAVLFCTTLRPRGCAVLHDFEAAWLCCAVELG